MKTLIAIAVMLLSVAAQARVPLTGDVTYYVAPNGTGDCLTPTTPCAPQTAWSGIRDSLDLSCHRVTVQFEEGVYDAIDVYGALTGACSIDSVTFHGNPAHPNTVSIESAQNAIKVHEGAWLKIEGLQMVSRNPDFMAGGHGLIVYENARVMLGTVAFGDCTFAHMDSTDGAQIHAEGASIYLTGISAIFALAEDHGRLWLNNAGIYVLTSYQAFSDGMFHTSRGSLIDLTGTFINQMYGAPLFGYIAIAEENSVIILLGLRYPGNMGAPQTRYGGQVTR